MSDTPNQPILRARHQPTTATPKQAVLDVQLARAEAVARAGDAIPKAYRSNTGAVLLASEWAESRGLDLLTAMQTVTFIHGRPSIDATMQRALAQRAGYTVKVTEATPSSAVVAIYRADDKLGEAVYTMEDARRAGLAEKDNYRQNPEDMMVARATTRAMRRFAPDVMIGLVVDAELDEIELRESHAAVVDVTVSGADGQPKETEGPTSPAAPTVDESGDTVTVDTLEDPSDSTTKQVEALTDAYRELSDHYRKVFREWRDDQQITRLFAEQSPVERAACARKLRELAVS